MDKDINICENCPFTGAECVQHHENCDCEVAIAEYNTEQVLHYYDNKLREVVKDRVAEYIFRTVPALNKLQGKEFCKALNAICDAVVLNNWNLFRIVDKKYMAEDLCNAFVNNEKPIPSPEDIAVLVERYDDCLADSEIRTDARHDIENIIVEEYYKGGNKNGNTCNC